jgi:hypothetical protein
MDLIDREICNQEEIIQECQRLLRDSPLTLHLDDYKQQEEDAKLWLVRLRKIREGVQKTMAPKAPEGSTGTSGKGRGKTETKPLIEYVSY